MEVIWLAEPDHFQFIMKNPLIMNKNIALLFILLGLALPIFAQQTTVYTEAYEAYKKGNALYDRGVFGKAQREFLKTINLLRPTNEA